jgi:integrase
MLFSGFQQNMVSKKRLENQKTLEPEELDAWSLFLYAMKAPMTKDRYKTRVAKFFDFIGLDNDKEGQTVQDKARIFANRGKEDVNWAFSNILRFIHFQKERVDRKEISGATVRNYAKSIKLFCDMADISIPWKKITRGLPRGKKYADDRIPTLEEIRKLVEYPDRRIKAIVYTMASSGIRVGAWDYLQWGHIRQVERDGEIIAAKMIVYAGEDEEYFTFISPEALRALQEWVSYRQSSGECIGENSWVMRDLVSFSRFSSSNHHHFRLDIFLLSPYRVLSKPKYPSTVSAASSIISLYFSLS